MAQTLNKGLKAQNPARKVDKMKRQAQAPKGLKQAKPENVHKPTKSPRSMHAAVSAVNVGVGLAVCEWRGNVQLGHLAWKSQA